MGLVYFVTLYQCFIRARNKHKKREIVFFFYRMPDSCIVFGCNNKSDPEDGMPLHRIPFFNDHRPQSDKKERNESVLQSLTVCACFLGE